MPKLKVDHIISFSSEDPSHIANNVLSNEPTKKWKCQIAGEKCASIVLQLEKASLISGIDIGNEHSAYVEVLVSRSGSLEDFTVLVVMSSFMTPLESRQSTNPNKVRMFTYEDLRSPERDQKWDRVKIVCTQPFNRRIQYGLSFITLNSLDAKEETLTTPQKIGKFAIRADSPNNLSVGNLFARRKESEEPQLSAAAAIRAASSHVTLNRESPKCKPKLKDVHAPSKTSKTDSSEVTPSRARNRNELLYNEDEEKPNSKIDKIIDQKNKEKQAKESSESDKVQKEQQSGNSNKVKVEQSNTSQNSKTKATSSSTPASSNSNKRKLKDEGTPQKKPKLNKITKPFKELLTGVTIVISGIENPERSTIRTEALAMGAKYKTEWGNHSTHLICAFTNTPKFAQVKGKGKIVNRMWISDCHSERKRLPWRRYALDPKDHAQNESEDEIFETVNETQATQCRNSEDDDTEEEIEKCLVRQMSKDICFQDTDEENTQIETSNDFSELPDFFSTKVLYIDKELSKSTTELLTRYIIAYNGVLVDDPSDIVNYAISAPSFSDTLHLLCPEATVVSPDWIWECHNAKKVVSDDDYRL